MKEILTTERLILREMAMGDLDSVAAMIAHPEVMRYWPRCYDRGEARDWIRRQIGRYERDGHGYWLAVDRKTGEPIGQAGLLQTGVEKLEFPALGYIIHQPFWRRGFATEAAFACVDYVRDQLEQAAVYTLIRPENKPSLGVAARLGMKAERLVPYAGFDHLLMKL